MAYGARHMFYILFDVVLLTSTVAGVQPLSDMHVSGNQDVVYDYKSDLTGTGGLPVCA